MSEPVQKEEAMRALCAATLEIVRRSMTNHGLEGFEVLEAIGIAAAGTVCAVATVGNEVTVAEAFCQEVMLRVEAEVLNNMKVQGNG